MPGACPVFSQDSQGRAGVTTGSAVTPKPQLRPLRAAGAELCQLLQDFVPQ